VRWPWRQPEPPEPTRYELLEVLTDEERDRVDRLAWGQAFGAITANELALNEYEAVARVRLYEQRRWGR
jgi:hypothetical protein